jgi:Xaa-Pro dipeptidase
VTSGSHRTDLAGSPFPVEEFHRRQAALFEAVSAADLDAVLVVRPENIYYLTGYRAAHIASRTSALHAVLLGPDVPARLVVRSLERATVGSQCAIPVLHEDHEDPYAVLATHLAEAGTRLTRVGVEESFLRVSQVRRLQQVLPAELVDVSGVVEQIAATPSAAELDAIRQSAVITDIGLAAGLGAIVEGAHAYDAVGAAHAKMYAAGQSDFDKSLVAVWSGPDGGHMHDTAVEQQFVQGDLATVEIMGVHHHYRTGNQACVHVGPRPARPVVDAHRLVVEMHEAARAVVAPGVQASEVFAAASAVYRSVRGADYYRRVGGSMGLTNFALDLVKGRTDLLRPGTVLLVQTLVDDPALIAIGSTVLVTETGCEPLTTPVLELRTTG